MNAPLAILPKGRGSDVRVSLGDNHGSPVVDIRTFVGAAPTRRGICVPVGQLRPLIAALQDAEAATRGQGAEARQ